MFHRNRPQHGIVVGFCRNNKRSAFIVWWQQLFGSRVSSLGNEMCAGKLEAGIFRENPGDDSYCCQCVLRFPWLRIHAQQLELNRKPAPMTLNVGVDAITE